MIEIILMEPESAENLGSVARIMKNFDFNELVLINPKIKNKEKALIVAKHAKDVLSKAKKQKVSYLKKLDYLIGTTAILGTDYNIPRNAINPGQLSEKLSKINKIHENRRFSGHRKSIGFSRELKVGILIGREGQGLNNKEIGLCDVLVTIPASKKYSTLNVSHALSIILYEIFKKSEETSVSHINFASKKELQIINKYFNKILNKVEFSTKEKKDTQRKVWKRIFGKVFLTKREAFAVMGLFRKLVKK